MEKYRKLKQIGEGASGIVFLAAVIPAYRREFEEHAQKRLLFHRPSAASSQPPQASTELENGSPLSGRKRKQPSDDSRNNSESHDNSGDGGDVGPEDELKAAEQGEDAVSKKHRTADPPADAAVAEAETVNIDGTPADSAEQDVKIVAIKKIRMRDSREGISMDAVREIKLVQELGHHPYLVTVYDIFNFRSNVNIVMEYMLTDLDKVIKDKSIQLSHADIKQYMRMILMAVDHCHSRWILHRDLKPLNLLVSDSGNLKLGDFGIAKLYGSPDRRMTNQACTLWYRAPELLFGARFYGAAMDMWSVGCIFGELMQRSPMFPGTGEINQLSCIFNILGTPKSGDWPDVECLPSYVPFKPVEPRALPELFPGASSDALDLLGRLLSLDPNKRPSAKQALEHEYFRRRPAPTPVTQLRERLRERVRMPKAPRAEQLAGNEAGGQSNGADSDDDAFTDGW